jgi:hypothetical protein
LSSNVDSIKEITKHCVMMNNQIEQMISLQNKLYEQLISEEQTISTQMRESAMLKACPMTAWLG